MQGAIQIVDFLAQGGLDFLFVALQQLDPALQLLTPLLLLFAHGCVLEDGSRLLKQRLERLGLNNGVLGQHLLGDALHLVELAGQAFQRQVFGFKFFSK